MIQSHQSTFDYNHIQQFQKVLLGFRFHEFEHSQDFCQRRIDHKYTDHIEPQSGHQVKLANKGLQKNRKKNCFEKKNYEEIKIETQNLKLSRISLLLTVALKSSQVFLTIVRFLSLV